MSRVYSARLAAGSVDAAVVVAYTVPEGMKAVVLDLETINVGSDPAELRMGLLPVGGSELRLWSTGNAGADFPVPWQGRLVLNAGDSLVIGSDGPFDYAVSGYLFIV